RASLSQRRLRRSRGRPPSPTTPHRTQPNLPARSRLADQYAFRPAHFGVAARVWNEIQGRATADSQGAGDELSVGRGEVATARQLEGVRFGSEVDALEHEGTATVDGVVRADLRPKRQFVERSLPRRGPVRR